MSDDEIIDRILSRAKEKNGETIPVEYIMKTVLGIREPNTIRRILQKMQKENIGGNKVAGGAFFWNDNARKISDEGYLNYIKRKELAKANEEEHQKIIFENDKVSLEINKHELKFKGVYLFIIIASFLISLASLFISIFIK